MACWTAPRISGSRCACGSGAASATIGRSRASGNRLRMPRTRPLVRQLVAQERERVGHGEIFGRFRAPVAVLELTGREPAVAHDHAMRNADELGVRELDARAL